MESSDGQWCPAGFNGDRRSCKRQPGHRTELTWLRQKTFKPYAHFSPSNRTRRRARWAAKSGQVDRPRSSAFPGSHRSLTNCTARSSPSCTRRTLAHASPAHVADVMLFVLASRRDPLPDSASISRRLPPRAPSKFAPAPSTLLPSPPSSL